MKKAALAVLLLGAALCIPGCGFEEGAGASVTVIQATPTPIPTPTPEDSYTRSYAYSRTSCRADCKRCECNQAGWYICCECRY